MFERFFRRRPPPLTGAPPVRRIKSYSAQSGYVYQYHYAGCRPSRHHSEDTTEYVFEVSADRTRYTPVSVHVAAAAVAQWETAHQRTLASNELYAVAKVSLFQAFDDRADPAALHAAVHVRAADLDGVLETLGLD